MIILVSFEAHLVANWENALYEARRYHAKKMSSRYNEGIDYDENGEIFDNFPEIIKDALNYLCEIGEID